MSNFFKLSEICDFSGGSQPPKSTFSTVPKKDYIRLLQIRDFSSDAKAVYIPKSLAKNKCEDKDILIGRYGASVGQIHKGKSGSYNVALIKTIPDESKIDRNYLYYYLISPYFQIPLERIADRAAQAGFSKKDISDFKIRLPSIKEQQQIVTILDGIFEGIEKTKGNIEENLKNSEDLLKSYNHSIFNEIGKKTEKIKTIIPITK